MEKCKRIETRLPEAMIQLIQSFMSEEEAARTTLISKSWYNAWLTRPVLVLRNLHWKSSEAEFSKFAVKTMRRYQDSNLKIESLRLKIQGCTSSIESLARRLIVDAMKMGATDLNLKFNPTTLLLPLEVLGSETLLRLSVSGCEIDGNFNCSMLTSLSLDSVRLKSDKSFFDDFESRFPCLEDMSLVRCYGIGRRVKSSSLKRISIVLSHASELELEVPNLAVFSYSGEHVPESISIRARDEWESHISIEFRHFHTWSYYALSISYMSPQVCNSLLARGEFEA